MARAFAMKKRGVAQRKKKPVYLLIAEGRNKTETMYFSHFQDQDKGYTLRIVKAGNNTDVYSLYKAISKKWDEYGLSENEGDRAFIVLDMDADEQKAGKIRDVIRQNKHKGITFVVSNPTFEIWFLLHFKYTTKHYVDGHAVIEELKKYIPNYEKNADVFSSCEQMTENAIRNAEKLEDNFEGELWPSRKCNPRTDVGRLVKDFK